MALTTSEIQILRFVQKHKGVTPTEYLRGMGLPDTDRVTVRKAMMRLEEQGILKSDEAGAQVRSYSLTGNFAKVDFIKVNMI